MLFNKIKQGMLWVFWWTLF